MLTIRMIEVWRIRPDPAELQLKTCTCSECFELATISLWSHSVDKYMDRFGCESWQQYANKMIAASHETTSK